MKLYKWIFVLLLLTSCGHFERGSFPDKGLYRGVCFDKVISPYTYQIAQVEGDKVFYYALGGVNKKILSNTLNKLFSGEDSFKIIDCP